VLEPRDVHARSVQLDRDPATLEGDVEMADTVPVRSEFPLLCPSAGVASTPSTAIARAFMSIPFPACSVSRPCWTRRMSRWTLARRCALRGPFRSEGDRPPLL
jgi:hypothetical protein